MAAIPQSLADSARRSSSASHRANLSHGRGGAGNIGSTPSDQDPVSLETPTLKGDVYTTGRGGSGNMAKNDDPVAARRAQDVVGHPRRESTHAEHVGRGGAANVFVPSAEEVAAAKRDNAKWESAISDDGASSLKAGAPERKKPIGLADKGKEFLFNLGKKKGSS